MPRFSLLSMMNGGGPIASFHTPPPLLHLVLLSVYIANFL